MSELDENRMLVCLDGQQIDHTTQHATMKELRTLTYHCNTCGTAIRSRDSILATEWSKEVPSKTLLDRYTKKAFLLPGSHIPGCPYSLTPYVSPEPFFVRALSASHLDVLGKLTVIL
jgi:hypothetical protein